MVPVVAVLAGGSDQQVNEEVGVGAIIGAPMMLATLALLLVAIFAAHKRGWSGEFKPERSGIMRDLRWFLAAFGLATVAIFIPHQYGLLRGLIAFSLVLMYFIYLMLTIRASAKLVVDGHGTEADNPLLLSRIDLPENTATIVLQLGIGLALIVVGAKGFVHGIEHLSALIGVSALVLSLLIVPFATELPEKINSILWIRRHRDTLVFGNITGAMVFQGSLLPALGIMLTPWEPRPEVLLGMGLTLAASIYLMLMLKRGHLKPWHLLVNGVCYIACFLTLTW